MALLGPEHNGNIHQRHFSLRRDGLGERVVICGNRRIGSCIASLVNGIVDVDKDVARVGKPACTRFFGHAGHVRHNSHIFGRRRTCRIGFLDERTMNRDVAKLDRVLELGLGADDFNFGKFTNNVRHHMSHEGVKHGDRVGALGPSPFVGKEQRILQRVPSLEFRIELLRLDDMTSTTGKTGFGCGVHARRLESVSQ